MSQCGIASSKASATRQQYRATPTVNTFATCTARKLADIRCSRRHRSTCRRHVRLHAAQSDLPQELQGLVINVKGDLCDSKTGSVINDFGATRFDVAVRAIRGEFDPPQGTANTEQSAGLLLESLMQFPADYTFQVVVKNEEGNPRQLVDAVKGCIERKCEVKLPDQQCMIKERLGGKYLSLAVTALVRAPQVIQAVFDELGQDTRVIIKY